MEPLFQASFLALSSVKVYPQEQQKYSLPESDKFIHVLSQLGQITFTIVGGIILLTLFS
jgi:hypothetical protein